MEKPIKVVEQNDPERIQITYKDKGTIYLISTPEGFIVDVYNEHQDECVTSFTVWDDDFEE